MAMRFAPNGQLQKRFWCCKVVENTNYTKCLCDTLDPRIWRPLVTDQLSLSMCFDFTFPNSRDCLLWSLENFCSLVVSPVFYVLQWVGPSARLQQNAFSKSTGLLLPLFRGSAWSLRQVWPRLSTLRTFQCAVNKYCKFFCLWNSLSLWIKSFFKASKNLIWTLSFGYQVSWLWSSRLLNINSV